MEPISIKGGAGAYEAAAVIAVLTELLGEEDTARSTIPRRPIPPAWVRVGNPPSFGRFNPPILPD